MNRGKYIKPDIVSYSVEKILEIIGPGHSASSQITVDVWRGAKLDSERPAEYRIAKVSPHETIHTSNITLA